MNTDLCRMMTAKRTEGIKELFDFFTMLGVLPASRLFVCVHPCASVVENGLETFCLHWCFNMQQSIFAL